MKKCKRSFNLFTFILLVTGFLLAPVNLVFADGLLTDTCTLMNADDKKDDDKKEGGEGKEGEEEPDCE